MISNAATYIGSYGIKPSPQRVVIMQYLMEHCSHPSADEIYNSLVAIYPTLSRTTVYNTLWLFAESGAIDVLTIDRSTARFDYSERPHGHFFCTRCGKIIDVLLPQMPEFPGPDHEIARIDVSAVQFKGICRDCETK